MIYGMQKKKQDHGKGAIASLFLLIMQIDD
jgi:hypothetical protein